MIGCTYELATVVDARPYSPISGNTREERLTAIPGAAARAPGRGRSRRGAGMLLVLAARVAMEEADRDRFHAVGDQPTRSFLHRMTIDWTADLAAPVGALGDGNTQLARHQWRGELDEQVV